MTESQEKEILELLNSQNAHIAFEKLVVSLSKPLYFFIRRMVIHHDDANDLVQDVFIKVWTHIEQFRGEAKFSTWIYTIATRCCIDFLRKKNRFIPWDGQTPFKNHHLEADTMYNGDEAQRKLDQALLQLPNKQRLVFQLHYFEEKKFSEIAQITGTSEGALKASYHHAVKKIEKIVLAV